MKTYKIIILINELQENHFQKIPGLDRPKISVEELISLNKKNGIPVSREDVFVGQQANWCEIENRIEDYKQLSFLREGQLEINYYSIYDVLTRLYAGDVDKYFHFYDECVSKKQIERLVHSFPPDFQCSFHNRSNENIKVLTNKTTQNRVKTMPLFSRFLSIGNNFQNLQFA